MNVNLYGTQGKWLMVDCGITFADANYPGVDVILPDLQFIEERLDDLLGIVLTHGHEDHIGALPYFAADLGVPLYATPFTAGLIYGKLEEEGITDKVELNIVKEDGPFTVGPFTMTYTPLAHSIPEGNAILIETPYGKVFHTGDWKLDESPALGGASTAAELTAIGDQGVLALVCDSTNVFNPEASGSEIDVRKGLDEVVAAIKGRVLVTTFASNAARLQTLGRSRRGYRAPIVRRGALARPDHPRRQGDRLSARFPPDDRFRHSNEPATKPSDDRRHGRAGRAPRRAQPHRRGYPHPQAACRGHRGVLIAADPGQRDRDRQDHEHAGRRKGVEIITDRQAFVHVSGHPGRPELAEMYRWIRPEIILPVHGEVRHMHEQARFAKEQGVPQAITQVNGDIWKLAPGKPKQVGNAPVGRLVLDGDVILPADGTTINERRRIALYGQISVAVAIQSGRLKGAPQIRVQGVPVEEDRDSRNLRAVLGDVRLHGAALPCAHA
jgi:ribonuclease J